MNTKIMEGLAGAGTNMDLINVPMRVFKAARLKGDTSAMERAMGYAGELRTSAEAYRSKAEEGLKEEAIEAREKQNEAREEAVRKRREEREKLEKEPLENRDADAGTDTVEISEEGKILFKNNIESGSADSDEIKTDTVKEPKLSRNLSWSSCLGRRKPGCI